MSEIVVAKPSECRIDAATLRNMYRFRDRIFRQTLKWDVTSEASLERDGFDDLDPVYVISRSAGSVVNGCWRMLPTVGPYMLRDTFPELLRGEKLPCDPHILELSRFAVDASGGKAVAQATFSMHTFELLRAIYEYAIANDINEYVTVCSVAMERLMRTIGLPLRRLGDGKATRIGNVLSVACFISVNEQSRAAVYGDLRDDRAGAA